MEKKMMDNDISGWVLEFLIRSSVPDSLIQNTLPLSAADSRLHKTLLLRTLHSHLLKASLSETSLHILELLDQLNRNDAVPPSDSMRRAYCSLAVECSVKYLAASPEDPSGEYFSAVRRIWRGRVAHLSDRSGLLSDELSRWGDDVEAALWDPRVSERLAGLNTRRDAMDDLKRYLKEALETMGPTFLDSVATLPEAKGLCAEGVCEYALGGESVRKLDGGLEGSGNEKRDPVDDADGACRTEDVAATVENRGMEQLEERVEERVGASVDANHEPGGSDSVKGDKEIQKGNLQLKRKHSALLTRHRGVKISGAEEVEPAKSQSKYDPLPSAEVNKVRESLKSSSMELRALVKDPLPDALHKSEVVRSNLATKDMDLVPPVENQSGDVDIPGSGVCMSIVPYRPNDANLGKKVSVHCSNVRRPNLMERRSSACTYEWDDSIDNSPHGRQPRRKKRKWTSLEEETLRAGVKMFGEGNWATIRSFYSNIFENRSGVDLKDKWRNMIR